MQLGDYVQHRKTGERGTVVDTIDGWLWIYSPILGPLKELWSAPERELTRLLKSKEING